jgi:putative flippase GtrA
VSHEGTKARRSVCRWGLFNLVGLGGFVLQIASLVLLSRHLDVPPLIATIVALELAALQNFVAHSCWTWGDRRPSTTRKWLQRYWKYQVAKTASLAANLGITMVCVYAGMPIEVANTAAVLACAIPNYLVSDSLVFS